MTFLERLTKTEKRMLYIAVELRKILQKLEKGENEEKTKKKRPVHPNRLRRGNGKRLAKRG